MIRKLLSLIPPMPWHRPKIRVAPGDRVILLHGLWRSHWAMDDLAVLLNKQGYETLNIPYPSFRKTLDQITDGVREAIAPSQKTTHYVTHSMGGIIFRCLAHRFPEVVTGKTVMLAPPNQGSEIIDWLSDSLWGRLLVGPGGLELSTKNIRQQISAFENDYPVAVIMGTSKRIRLFESMLGEAHDGIVTVEGGYIKGMKKLQTVPAGHTMIMHHQEAQQQIFDYLSGQD